MKKLYFTSLFILFFSFGFSQSYPYLNASTANKNEFPVDKDTNIYMFHGNRLVKTDKNFNVIWANTYSGITFTNLLLSKTGSIYFLSGNIFGKISANGVINWIKNTQNISAVLSASTAAAYSFGCGSLLLDRNNQLLISGQGSSQSFLLKTDTNGIAVKLKVFDWATSATQLENLSIVSDSAGTYKLVGYGMTGISQMGFSLYSFSDNLNTFTGIKTQSTGGYYNFSWGFIRSKFINNYYIRIKTGQISTLTDVNDIAKFNVKGDVVWYKRISATAPSLISFIGYYLEETNTGDLFFASSTSNSNSNYTSAFVKVDSNGVANNYGTTMLSSYFVYNVMINSYDIPSHSPRSIHNNNYYFDISGYYFPTNPLAIQKFNSTLTYSCASTVTSTNTNLIFSLMSPKPNPVIHPITSFTVPVFTSSVTSVTFTVNSNFCTVLKVGEEASPDNELKIYPNPVNNKLNINGQFINALEIYDVSGKKIKTVTNTSSVDVADLSEGIYFIRIKTDRGEFNKKFIKN